MVEKWNQFAMARNGNGWNWPVNRSVESLSWDRRFRWNDSNPFQTTTISKSKVIWPIWVKLAGRAITCFVFVCLIRAWWAWPDVWFDWKWRNWSNWGKSWDPIHRFWALFDYCRVCLEFWFEFLGGVSVIKMKSIQVSDLWGVFDPITIWLLLVWRYLNC